MNVGMELEFRNVSLRKPKSTEFILSEINGKAQTSSLTGIMGQSGSGKTTLVNILVGKVRATSGSLSLNGVEKKLAKGHNFRALIGFVPQDDIIHPHLTVFENILHSARIRLGGALNDKIIQKHVDTIIDGLGLSNVKDSVVGSEQRRIISGGERKRVSIALELVAAPQVLILDEPTSGLDAQAALSIMELLRLFSRQGLTVICVIHQPRVEIFEALDNLLILDLGKAVYSGKALEAKRHFEAQGYVFNPNLNPADLIMDIVSGKLQPADAGIVYSKQQKLPHGKMEPVTSGRHDESNMNMSLFHELETKHNRSAAWHRQVYLCLLRDIIQQSRQAAMFLTEIMGGILTGLLIGLAIYELRGQIFQGIFLPPFEVLSSAVNYKLVTQLGLLGCLAITFAAAAPSVGIFGEEILIFQRESLSGHSEGAYFVGKVLSSLPRSFLAAFHYTTLYAVLATPHASFNILLVLNFFYFYCIYGIGSVVAAVSSRENGPLVCLLVTIVIAVFGGSEPRLPTVKGWHMEWLWYMSPGMWYSEAFVSEHVTPFAYLFDLSAAAQETGYTFNRTGFDIW
ncbi:hypothetical protein N7499_006002 [Penicillium canescens]|uniref:ABC transporter domain-containing protein n=1 Tax=Penicillium canescens TaxID=5083 RepID=A0AAD6IDS3_PENCN|nr:uncharacterized protein N7446_001775 [Penicillium canescens]KAJ6043577.1 hypothetical protein N7460_004932 [Penicillium canescens]KAJ6055051.1 hypothetical protein N7444_004149 [Penicillium canescens]KAJ6073998.1 hypothetical protein N7446_001775 [Penicillium canescens]KAJ6081128.1 hypothetical protein N7499_006002 [Penicillium canescens]KAJ6177075.1 hypothetical protein N7485_003989 [Penicillium canescens]